LWAWISNKKEKYLAYGGYNMKSISLTTIDDAIYSIKSKLCKKHTLAESERYMSPLVYYISTGRSSTEFLKILVNLSERQKSTIANKLVKNYGNDKAAIDSICQYIGYERHCL